MPVGLILDTAGGANAGGYPIRNVGSLHVGGAALPTTGYVLQVTGNGLLTGNLRVEGTAALVGAITTGTINGQTISSAANFTGTMAIAGNTTIGGTLTLGNNTVRRSVSNSYLDIYGGDLNGGRIILYGGSNATLPDTVRFFVGATESLRIASTGAVTIFQGASLSSTLAVTGATTLSSTLLVTGSATFAGLVLAGEGIEITGGTSAAGRITKNSGAGLTLRGITGSSYDFYVASPSNALILRVPTGTVDITFGGAISVTGTSTLTGDVSLGGSLFGIGSGGYTMAAGSTTSTGANYSLYDSTTVAPFTNGHRWRISGTDAMLLNAAGHLGLGTTDIEAWSSAYRAIEWNGAAIMGGSTLLHLTHNAYFDGAWKYKSATVAANLYLAGGEFAVRVAPAGVADAAIAWTTALTIDNTGVATFGSHLSVPATSRIYLDGGSNTYIFEAASDDMRFVVGGTTVLRLGGGLIRPYQHLVADTHNTLDIGTTSTRFRTLYAVSIAVTSTTVVTNLNADLLDGQHASAFATAAALTAHTGASNPHGITKTTVGLSNVENTALSTWTGSTNLTTVGTLGSLNVSGAIVGGSLNLGGATVTDILSATKVWDPPSIGSQMSVQTTVTVTGAAVGDAVFISPQGGFAAGSIVTYGFVSSANTVTIVAHNGSSTVIDPASATYRVVVFKI